MTHRLSHWFTNSLRWITRSGVVSLKHVLIADLRANTITGDSKGMIRA